MFSQGLDLLSVDKKRSDILKICHQNQMQQEKDAICLSFCDAAILECSSVYCWLVLTEA